MKKLIISLTALFTAFCFSFAQEEKDSNEQSQKNIFAGIDPAMRIQLLKQFDKDGDGRLDADERKAAMEALKNKSANLKELKKKHAKDVIKRFDKDNDGKLDEEELSAFLDEQREMFEKQRSRMGPRRNFKPTKEMLEKYDKDGDGKLDDAERKTMFQEAHAKREAILKRFDKDGDGKLDDAERENLVKDPEFQSMMKRMIPTNISRGQTPPPPPASK